MNLSVWYTADTFNIPLPSKDQTVDNFGESLIHLCIEFNVHVLNGRMCKDLKGEVTNVKNIGTSVVDYIVLSSELFPNVIDFEFLHNCNIFSDHLPVICELSTKHITGMNNKSKNYVLVKFTVVKKN